jgi:hypothetical protein
MNEPQHVVTYQTETEAATPGAEAHQIIVEAETSADVQTAVEAQVSEPVVIIESVEVKTSE